MSSTGGDKPAAAYTRKFSAASSQSLSSTALVYCFLLSLQFGVQPILTKKYMGGATKSTVVFMQELAKLVISIAGISMGRARWSDVVSGWTVTSWLRLALLPATIYLVQNMCSLLAYQNLDPMTYNVLNQTKTLSAALCCYIVMNKKQSRMQVFALLLLLVAALVMESVLPMEALTPSYWAAGRIEKPKVELSPTHITHGVIPIMVASFLSGLAGAVTQKSLQWGKGRHALLFTLELCAASLLLLAASFVTSEDGRSIRERGFFDQWTPYTLIPIMTNSLGGILVGLVIKYAGTVRKGFALIFGILLSGLLQSLVDENKSLSKEDVAGGVLAALSLWLHATNPYVPPSPVSTLDEIENINKDTAQQSRRTYKSKKEE